MPEPLATEAATIRPAASSSSITTTSPSSPRRTASGGYSSVSESRPSVRSSVSPESRSAGGRGFGAAAGGEAARGGLGAARGRSGGCGSIVFLSTSGGGVLSAGVRGSMRAVMNLTTASSARSARGASAGSIITAPCSASDATSAHASAGLSARFGSTGFDNRARLGDYEGL